MSQYVEKFPLPNPKDAMGMQIIDLAKRIYELTGNEDTSELETTLDKLVWQAFGFVVKEAAG